LRAARLAVAPATREIMAATAGLDLVDGVEEGRLDVNVLKRMGR